MVNFKQIGGVIYDSCPLLFKVLKDSESKNRLIISFAPNWYHVARGIDFSEHWHTDPFYRQQTCVQMKRAMTETLPEYNPLDIGDSFTYENCPATLSAAYGVSFIPAIFGKTVEYYPNNWPAAKGHYLDDEEVKKLTVPDINNNSFFQNFLGQLKKISEKEGQITGQLNYQGILNIALKLRGEQIFIDMMTAPLLSEHLFTVVTETLITVIKKIYQIQKASGAEIADHFVTSNCTVNMISGPTYHKHLLKFDKKLAESFKHFGIHNCAWKVDPYLESYAQIPNVAYLDFGIDSDFKKIRKLFPRTRRSLMYDPERLIDESVNFVEDFKKIKDELFPCDIILTPLDYHIPLKKIHEFIGIAQKYMSS